MQPTNASDIGATDGRTEPEITRHVEPESQGGAHYIRCEGCGREVIGWSERRLVHRDDCPVRLGIERGSVLRDPENGKKYVVIDVDADSVCAFGVGRRIEYEFPTRWIQANCEVA